MKTTLRFTAAEVVPSRNRVLHSLGVPELSAASQPTLELVERSLALFVELSQPVGLYQEISLEEFAAIYRGEQPDQDKTPLEGIYPVADHLALFVVTLGEAICLKIGQLFESQDFPLGTLLDVTASEGTENLAANLVATFRDNLKQGGQIGPEVIFMPFSPGYCGWQLASQGKLLGSLKAESMGVSLNSSYLMSPLKSISGVIVAGHEDTFVFDYSFPCCETCNTYACSNRLERAKQTND